MPILYNSPKEMMNYIWLWKIKVMWLNSDQRQMNFIYIVSCEPYLRMTSHGGDENFELCGDFYDSQRVSG
jgi:hypothetical protein